MTKGIIQNCPALSITITPSVSWAYVRVHRSDSCFGSIPLLGILLPIYRYSLQACIAFAHDPEVVIPKREEYTATGASSHVFTLQKFGVERTSFRCNSKKFSNSARISLALLVPGALVETKYAPVVFLQLQFCQLCRGRLERVVLRHLHVNVLHEKLQHD